MVLEIPEENSKQTIDGEKCSLRELIDELSQTVSDFTINCHDLVKPSAVGDNSDCLRGVRRMNIYFKVTRSELLCPLGVAKTFLSIFLKKDF